jgi:hypothetical protein
MGRFEWVRGGIVRIPETDVPLLVEMSSEHYYRILKYANEASPVYFRLKNSISTESGTFLIPCEVSDAEMLLGVAKHFCPGAVSQIDSVILAFRAQKSPVSSKRNRSGNKTRHHP